MSHKITLTTSDQVQLIADHYPSTSPNGYTLLLIHMMPSDRKSWQTFAQQANLAGFNCLAPDLRGHGESISQLSKPPANTSTKQPQPQTITLDYTQFTDAQHRASYHDIQACIDYLQTQTVPLNKTILIGASIGANLTLWYTQKHPQIPTCVLISPGLDYRGILTEPLAQTLFPAQSTLLIAGQQDKYPAQTIKRLEAALNGEKQSIILPDAAHGTALFDTHPKLISRILSWLSETLAI
jgi:pimeloyl-ACP methyl ester carboxylesterase